MNTESLINVMQQRARQIDVPYAGVALPKEAFQLWQHHPSALLVDIRTQAEWDWVGRIPKAIEIEWQHYPEGTPNPHFLSELERAATRDHIILFICRSGVRSHNAAMLATDAGFSHCINVLEGFEGGVDAQGHRGTTGGWRLAGLPWQS